MNINSRINEIREYFFDGNNLKFAAKMEFTPQYASNITKEGKKVGQKILNKILEKLPSIDPVWLKLGEGSMLKEEATPAQFGQLTPLLLQEAAAGFGSENFAITEKDIQAQYLVPDFNGIDFMIRVKGNSMYPKYSSGDVIACRKLKESKFIEWNKPHLIATTEHGLIVKRIRPHEEGILAVSDNEKYAPFVIPNVEITGVAVIVGVIRLE